MLFNMFGFPFGKRKYFMNNYLFQQLVSFLLENWNSYLSSKNCTSVISCFTTNRHTFYNIQTYNL